MTPEGKVKAKVNAVLKVFGPRVWRFMPVQTGYGAPALDYLLCVNGTFVAIETKVKGKYLTALQQVTSANMEMAGGLVFVVCDDRSLWITTRCLMQLLHGSPYAIKLIREWRGSVDLQTQDEGACRKLLRQFIKGEKVDPATRWDHGAFGETP